MSPLDRIAELFVFGGGCGIGIPLLTLVLLIVGVLRHRQRDRDRTPRCKTCGYNLTGNVSGVCPECGTAVGEPR